MQVVRSGQPESLTMSLPSGWRRADDISWRVSTWPLRRMFAGGMVLERAGPDQLRYDQSPGSMALLVKRVGQYGPHGTAKRVGFREGDIITAYAGRSDLQSEADLMRHAAQKHKAGDRVQVRIVRNGQPKTLTLPIQE